MEMRRVRDRVKTEIMEIIEIFLRQMEHFQGEILSSFELCSCGKVKMWKKRNKNEKSYKQNGKIYNQNGKTDKLPKAWKNPRMAKETERAKDTKNMKRQRNLQSVFGKQQIFGDQNNGKWPKIEIKQRQSKAKIEMERSKNLK